MKLMPLRFNICLPRKAVEEGGNRVSHEHILTKDANGEVWVVVLERDEIRLYPCLTRTSHNGDEERQQFEIFVASLPKDHAFHRYVYEGEEETLHCEGVLTHALA
jgi:hypothetical protein